MQNELRIQKLLEVRLNKMADNDITGDIGIVSRKSNNDINEAYGTNGID